MQNEIILRFCIWGFTDISHDDITKSLGVNPSKIYVKGEKKNPKFSGLAKENGWLLEPISDRYSPFEVQLNYLLQILESKREIIINYSTKYTCEISCGVFIYFDNEESTPPMHLDVKHTRILGELNLEVDFDIYCLPNKVDSTGA